MPIYKFAGHRFDADRLTLSKAGRNLPLRPKTACVLRLLVESRDRVVSKREMANAVWKSEHVTDQSLFQAISELRRTLGSFEPIKTHPNLGYQWITPTRRGLAATPLAAAAALCLAMILGVVPGGAPTTAVSASTSPGLPPAMQALANGLQSLGANQPHQAEAYFELALRENPAFDEARLMLSEALLAQGRVAAARKNTEQLVAAVQADSDPYVAVAAMELMSRTDQHEGLGSSALSWAIAAADRARDQGFVCAAADIEDRIVALMSPLVVTSPDATTANITPPPTAARAALSTVSDPLPDYCEQMQPSKVDPDAQYDPDVAHSATAEEVCVGRKPRDISRV